MENKYDKFTKEQLIELLKIDDEGALNLRNAYDAKVLEIERLKSALLDTNKRIDKAIEYINTNMIDEELKIYEVSQIDVRKLLDILKGEE